MPDSTNNQAPQVTPPQPYTPPPPLQPIGAPAPKSGSTVLKVVLIIVGIFVGLGLIGAGILAYGVWHLTKSIHTDSNGQITISTSKGTMTANSSEKFTESDLGIAIYPGAEQGKGSVRINMGGKSMVSAIFLTPDSKDKVIAFYKDKAGPGAQSIITGDSAEFIATGSTGDSITVTITQSAAASGGKTEITIVRVPKAASN